MRVDIYRALIWQIFRPLYEQIIFRFHPVVSSSIRQGLYLHHFEQVLRRLCLAHHTRDSARFLSYHRISRYSIFAPGLGFVNDSIISTKLLQLRYLPCSHKPKRGGCTHIHKVSEYLGMQKIGSTVSSQPKRNRLGKCARYDHRDPEYRQSGW